MARIAEAQLAYLRIVAGHRSWKSLCLTERLSHAQLYRLFGGECVGDEFVERLARILHLTPSALRAYLDALIEERAARRSE
jgi:hypothetical protein